MSEFVTACTADGSDTLLRVRVRPAARRNQLGGLVEILPGHGGPPQAALAVSVQAPAVGGKANTAVQRVVAEALALAGGSVTIERGAKSRDKVLRLSGLDPAEVVSTLQRRRHDAYR